MDRVRYAQQVKARLGLMAEPLLARVRAHPRLSLYAFSLLLHLIVAPFVIHDWDGYVFITTARDFLHGQSPYAIVEAEPSYIFIGDGVPVVNAWYAYPPVALLLMTPFYGLFTALLGAAPWVERVGVKFPFILGDLALAFVAAELVRLLLASEPLKAARRARLVEKLVLFNPFLIFISALWGMFDAWMVTFLLASLLFMERRSYAWSGAMLGLAVLVKPFPVFVAPLFLGYLWAKHGRDRVLPWIGGGVASAVAVCGPFLLTAPQGFLQQVVYNHAGRPPQGFTLAGLPLAFGWINDLIGTNLPRGITPEQISQGSFIVLATLMALLWAQAPFVRSAERLVHLTLVTLVAVLLVSKVVNEQYFVMPVVFATVAFALSKEAAHRQVMRWYTIGGMISVFFLGYHFLTFLPPDVALKILPVDPLDSVPTLVRWLGWTDHEAYIYPTLIAASSLLPALYFSIRLIVPELVSPLKQLARRAPRELHHPPPALMAGILATLLLLPVSAGVLTSQVEATANPPGPVTDGPLVAATYYLGWNNPAHDPRIEYGNWRKGIEDVPAEGYYTITAGKLQSDFRQMKENGIDVALYSYHEYDRPKLPAITRLAAENGVLSAPLVELSDMIGRADHRPRDQNGSALDVAMGLSLRNDTRDAIVNLIVGPASEFSHLPGWWKVEGRPVVYVGDAFRGFYDAQEGEVRARFTAIAVELYRNDTRDGRLVYNFTETELLSEFPLNETMFQSNTPSATVWRRAYGQLHTEFWEGVRERVEARVGDVYLVGAQLWKPGHGAHRGPALALHDLAAFDATFVRSPIDAWVYHLGESYAEGLAAWAEVQAVQALQTRGAGRDVILSVMPQHDDLNLRGEKESARVPAESGGRLTYDALWADTLAFAPDVVVIDSWNDFHRGTAIEPSQSRGASLLHATAVHAAALRSASPAPGAKALLITDFIGSSAHPQSGDPDQTYRQSVNLVLAAHQAGLNVDAVDRSGPFLASVSFADYDVVIVEPGARDPWTSEAQTLVARLDNHTREGGKVLILGSDVGPSIAQLASWTEPDVVGDPVVLLSEPAALALPAASLTRRQDVPADAEVLVWMRNSTVRMPALWRVPLGEGELYVTSFKPQGENEFLPVHAAAFRAIMAPFGVEKHV